MVSGLNLAGRTMVDKIMINDEKFKWMMGSIRRNIIWGGVMSLRGRSITFDIS